MHKALLTGPLDTITNRERASVFSLTGRPRLELGQAETAASPKPDADPWEGAVSPQTSPIPAPARPAPRADRDAEDPALALDDTAPQPVVAAEPGPGLPRRGAAAPGTHRGLPRRIRQASLAPQFRGVAETKPENPPAAATGIQSRSPEMARSLMSALQDGWQRGRVDDLDDPLGGPDGRPGRSGPSDGGAG